MVEGNPLKICPHLHCVAIPERFLMARCLDCGALCRLQIKKKEEKKDV